MFGDTTSIRYSARGSSRNPMMNRYLRWCTGERYPRLYFLTLESPATLSAVACMPLTNPSALVRPVSSSEVCWMAPLFRSPYQTRDRKLSVLLPAAFMDSLTDLSAVLSLCVLALPSLTMVRLAVSLLYAA